MGAVPCLDTLEKRKVFLPVLGTAPCFVSHRPVIMLNEFSSSCCIKVKPFVCNY